MLSLNIVFITFFFVFLFALLFFFVLVRFLWRRRTAGRSVFLLRRHPENPVLCPNSENVWESCGRFNPAAIQDDAGNTHILYRAVGSDGVSRIGYASAIDGVHFDDTLSYPVFVMPSPRCNVPVSLQRHDLVLYPSVGSWGGSEDPRMVRLG